VQNKNTAELAQAVALRAEFEAATEARKAKFKAIREENLPAEELDELAAAFDGMQITGENVARSEGRRGIIVGRVKENRLYTRTLTMRKEKDGWKVSDVSNERSEIIGIRQSSKKKGY
jgi:hypothetical protein